MSAVALCVGLMLAELEAVVGYCLSLSVTACYCLRLWSVTVCYCLLLSVTVCYRA